MKKCRICNNSIKQIINLKKIALVGNFLKKKQNQKKYKISLNYCKKCKHIQIGETVNPNLLFKKYLWETGVSKSNIILINDFINKMKKFRLNQKSKILEIASNDGSLIGSIKKRFNSIVLGIDPAVNLNNQAKKKKIKTINEYFDYKLSKKIKKMIKSFDYIIARNVIAHVRKPNEVFRGVENLLTSNGIFILEVPHLLNIIKYNQYDNIFHEHLGFHSLKSIRDLCDQNELKIFNVEKISSQGGSIRCFICKKNNFRKISSKVKKMLKFEQKSKLFSIKNLENYGKKIKTHSRKLYNFINRLKIDGKKISIYGASGKGQALMQYCKIDNKLIDFVFDKSKLKQKRYTPGTNIKILNPNFIDKKIADYLLILSWNIVKEIMKQENSFLQKGGKFIVPFPKPRILAKR
jgi:2-polyprenyl-3-methyl-5-hydroxy-6-metoxy-1,4-benzoquinol methylase